MNKYPRTYHFPFSPGATSDDKKAPDDYLENWQDKMLVITEKLDGENSCLTRDANYSRSHSVPAHDPWNRNLWEKGGKLDLLRSKIGLNEFVFGENLFAKHSIEYTNLDSDFYVFGAGVQTDNGLEFFNWDDVVLMADLLDLPTVPIIDIISSNIFKSNKDAENKIIEYGTGTSKFGPIKEGCVIRISDSFMESDFSKNVLKYVRANHVQTDQHWTKTWTKNKIN